MLSSAKFEKEENYGEIGLSKVILSRPISSICESIVYDIAKDFTFFQKKYLKNRRHKKNQRCIEIFEKSENDNYQ